MYPPDETILNHWIGSFLGSHCWHFILGERMGKESLGHVGANVTNVTIFGLGLI